MAQHPKTKRADAQADPAVEGRLPFFAALLWLVVAIFVFWLTWPDPATTDHSIAAWSVMVGIVVLLPAAFIWIVGSLARDLRGLRHELSHSSAKLDLMMRNLADQSSAKGSVSAAPSDNPPAAAPREQTAMSQFASRREVSRLIVPRAAPQVPSEQPDLALDTPQEDDRPPIARPDLIKALHFPDDEHDREGFAALRRALRDRDARKLVQASQDVLTLLSQDGIYMDDLHPGPVSADIWRRFAEGERGKTMDQLGGIRDENYLSVISTRSREDAIFRDAMHHFLRCYDQFLVTFEQSATDTDLLALAETRTSRAFMLLARTTGAFD